LICTCCGYLADHMLSSQFLRGVTRCRATDQLICSVDTVASSAPAQRYSPEFTPGSIHRCIVDLAHALHSCLLDGAVIVVVWLGGKQLLQHMHCIQRRIHPASVSVQLLLYSCYLAVHAVVQVDGSEVCTICAPQTGLHKLDHFIQLV
jgi:hypothetical protein